jgi:signal transduction histidine kinase
VKTETGQQPGDARPERLWELIEAGVFLSEELDLSAVLRRIVETACRVIGARYGALGVLNEDRSGLSDFVFHGLTEEDRERIGHLPVGRGLLGALIQDPRPIRLSDLNSDPRSVGFPAYHPPMNSFLGVPVRSRGQVFGNLYLTEKQGASEFTEEDERLAIVLASQAGVAVENARLYEAARESEIEAARRLVELESVHELGSAVLSEIDPDRVLRMIAMRARELVRADTAAIALREDDNDELRVRVAVGVRAGSAEGLRIPLEGSFAEMTMSRREPMAVHDIATDERGFAPMARALYSRSVVFAPLVEGGEAIGVLGVMHGETGHFGRDELFAVSRFASLASFAFVNARLLEAERRRADMESELAEARVRSELQDQTLKAVIRAQEEERRRIARELHDSAGQALASILLGLKVVSQEKTFEDAKARLADLRDVTAEAASEVRRIALELRPSVLDDLGLEAALERYTKDFEERTALDVQLSIDLGDQRLEEEIETVVYRVVQEALTNVVKYAGARAVNVSVQRRNGMVCASVSDDGGGFDLADDETTGLGIRGMRERAGLVGGRLDVRSSPREGTTVELELPDKPRNG